MSEHGHRSRLTLSQSRVRWHRLIAAMLLVVSGRAASGQSSLNRLIDSVSTVWRSAATLSAEDLDHLVEQTVVLRDVRMLRAARDAAIRAGAPVRVRVAALRTLYSFASGSVSADLPDSIPSVDTFIGGSKTERVAENGPQPVDTASIAALTTELAPLSTDANVNVRNLTTIVLRAVTYYQEVSPELTYVCGNTFRVTNRNPFPLAISYSVQGTSESALIVLSERPPTAAYTEGFIFTKATGAVQITSVSGLVWHVVQNRRTVCP